MAAPTPRVVKSQGRIGGSNTDELTELRTEFNVAVLQLRVLTAKMDLDGGITDTNYDALITNATAVGPAVINVIQ